MRTTGCALLLIGVPFALCGCGSDDAGDGGGTGGTKDAGVETGAGGTGATGGVASGGTAGSAGSLTGGSAGVAGATGGSGGGAAGGAGGGAAGTSGGAGVAGIGGAGGTDGGVSVLGDTCGNPFPVGPVPILVTGDTTGAGADYGYTSCPPTLSLPKGAGSPDHVYAFAPTSTGRYLVELSTTTLDSTLYAVTNCQDVDTTCVGGVDACGTNCTEAISLDGQVGSTYYLVVDGSEDDAPGQAGPYTLEIKNPPTNETCGSAIPINAVPFQHASNTIGAGKEYGLAPGVCAGISASYTGAGASDLVYAFTPTQSGIYEVTLSTAGFDAMLCVSTSCASTITSCVAGSESTGTFGDEEAILNATAGTTYYIFVDGYSATPSLANGGKYALSVKPPPPPPSNDTCATATVVSSLPYSATGSTVTAGSDYGFAPGTCQPANSMLGNGSNDVVYSFTPAVSGSYSFYLGGFDTLLYVVTDCANISATTCVAGIDNCSGICSESLTLTLNAGTTYYVIVDGWDNLSNVSGTYQLDIVENP